MLVLSRKKGESIMITDSIEIIVLESEGDAVKLGIKAPREVGIHRKEIFTAIQESNKAASSDREDLMRKLADWQAG